MNKEENCYICGSVVVNIYRVENDFLVYRCKKCGLKWIGIITADQIASFYGEKYFSNSDSKMGYKDYLADEENHRRNARNILYTIEGIRKLTGLKILDVGCAFGFLLDEARRLKGDVYGVEISGYACEYAKNKLGLDVINGEIDSSHFPPEFFDVVFLIGTIEHLISPKNTIAIINKVLKSDGLFVITTIDTSGLFPLYSIKPPEHLFYFNHNNISLLLTKLGFKIIKIKSYFVNYYLHDLFHRLSEFLSFSFLEFVSGVILKKIPNFRVKIPTNEMIVIAKKVGL